MKHNIKVAVCLCIVLVGVISSISSFAAPICQDYGSALNAFGIVETTKDNADTEITLGNALNSTRKIFMPIEGEAQQVYSNIPASDPYFMSAYWAYSIEAGLGKDRLEVNASINGEDLFKLLIIAAGYEYRVEDVKNPYWTAACKLDNDFRKFSPTKNVTYSEYADIVYKFLFLPAPVDTTANTVVSANTTILHQWLGIKYAYGTIGANEYTSVSGEEPMREGEFKLSIDNGQSVAFVGGSEYIDFIGTNVTIFYRETKDGNECVYVEEDMAKTLVIDGEGFEEINPSRRRIEYRDDLTETAKYKVKNVTYEYNSSVVYNGQYLKNPTDVFEKMNNASDITIEQIKLVDTNRNGQYDSLIIDTYKSYGVVNIDKENQVVKDLWGNIIDLGNDDKMYRMYTDAGDITFADIELNMLLKVKEAYGAKPLVTIEASKNSLLGNFYQIYKKSDGKVNVIIKIAEETHRAIYSPGSFVGGIDNQEKLAKYQLDNTLAHNVDKIMTGNHMYNLLLDEKGKIAAVNIHIYQNYSNWYGSGTEMTTYNTVEFGIGINLYKKSYWANDYTIKLVTKKKDQKSVSVETYEVSDDFKIKNIPKDISEKYGDKWENYSIEAMRELFQNNLFEIVLNDDGRIKTVVFPLEAPEEGKLAYMNEKNQRYMYKGNVFRSMTSRDVVTRSPLCYTVIMPEAGTEPGPSSLYRNIDISTTNFVEGVIYDINTYTYSPNSVQPDFVVITMDYDSLERENRISGNALAVVNEAYQMITELGVVDAYEVYGLLETATPDASSILASTYGKTYKTPPNKSITTDPDKVEINSDVQYLENVKEGDILQFDMSIYQINRNAFRLINSARTLYNYKSKTIIDTNLVTKGKVKGVSKGSFALLPDGKDDERGNYRVYSTYTNAARRIVKCVQGRGDNVNVSLGTEADLIDAMTNNYDVVIVNLGLIVVYEY